LLALHRFQSSCRSFLKASSQQLLVGELQQDLLAGLKQVVDTQIAPLLTFTNFFGWNEVWIASGWLLLTGLVVSTFASLITLRRYLKV
jgi:cell division transport system permease protein